ELCRGANSATTSGRRGGSCQPAPVSGIAFAISRSAHSTGQEKDTHAMSILVTPLVVQPEAAVARPSDVDTGSRAETRNTFLGPVNPAAAQARGWYPAFKVASEFAFAAVLLVVVSPFLAVA